MKLEMKTLENIIVEEWSFIVGQSELSEHIQIKHLHLVHQTIRRAVVQCDAFIASGLCDFQIRIWCIGRDAEQKAIKWWVVPEIIYDGITYQVCGNSFKNTGNTLKRADRTHPFLANCKNPFFSERPNKILKLVTKKKLDDWALYLEKVHKYDNMYIATRESQIERFLCQLSEYSDYIQWDEMNRRGCILWGGFRLDFIITEQGEIKHKVSIMNPQLDLLGFIRVSGLPKNSKKYPIDKKFICPNCSDGGDITVSIWSEPELGIDNFYIAKCNRCSYGTTDIESIKNKDYGM